MTTNICICNLQIKGSERKQEYLYSSSPRQLSTVGSDDMEHSQQSIRHRSRAAGQKIFVVGRLLPNHRPIVMQCRATLNIVGRRSPHRRPNVQQFCCVCVSRIPCVTYCRNSYDVTVTLVRRCISVQLVLAGINPAL